jgi:hypothetical protein
MRRLLKLPKRPLPPLIRPLQAPLKLQAMPPALQPTLLKLRRMLPPQQATPLLLPMVPLRLRLKNPLSK